MSVEEGRNRHRDGFMLGGLVLSVVLLNKGLSDVLFQNHSLLQQNLNDLILLTVTGWLGIKLAGSLGLPVWWDHGEKDGKSLWFLWGTGVLIIMLNTALNLYTYWGQEAQYLQLQPWSGSLDLLQVVLFSARAAISEELLFRFFAISMILWLLGRFNDRKKQHVAISVVVSSALFAFIHTSVLVPFGFGVLLSLLYLRHGLFPVMAIHFFANLIPYGVIAMAWL